MAKYRYRIEGGRYGGEAVLGTVNPAFASYYADEENQGDLVDAVLESEDWEPNEEVDNDTLLDPEGIPHPAIPGEDFYMWENDDIEHINSAYADGGFFVYEVPADGSDDYDHEKEVYEGEGILVYGREGGYFGTDDEPELINEEDEDKNKYVPVLAFHSSEKGGFGVWFVETDGEDFDEFKLGYGVVETNLAEFIDEDEVRQILRESPGILVVDKRDDGGYTTPIECVGEYATFISRIRHDPTIDNGINLWCVSDNLRKGAALNAVQIAELLGREVLKKG